MVSKTRKSKNSSKKQPLTKKKSVNKKDLSEGKKEIKQRTKKTKSIKKQVNGEKLKVSRLLSQVKSLKQDTSVKNKQLLSNQLLKLTRVIKIKDIASEIKKHVAVIKQKLEQAAEVFKSKEDPQMQKVYHEQLQKLGISDEEQDDQQGRMIASKRKHGGKLSQNNSFNKKGKNSSVNKTQKQIASERKHKLYEQNQLDYKEIFDKVQNLDTYLEVGLSFSHTRIRKQTIIFNKIRERAQNQRYS